VLACAFVFEGMSWYYGLKAFRTERRGRGILETIRVTKNPTSFAVLLEDSAALLGIAIALAGIFLSEALHAPWLDGAASVLIGALLCLVALVMVRYTLVLLVGDAAAPATLESLKSLLSADPCVEGVDKLLTVYLGPEEVLLAIQVRFRPERMKDVRQALARLRREIQRRYPRIRRIFIDATSIE
jgi:divalent metal cation (Fe/Co/Zn/Cd) transporter